jgi:2-methylcitrate dehydratase PrpD
MREDERRQSCPAAGPARCSPSSWRHAALEGHRAAAARARLSGLQDELVAHAVDLVWSKAGLSISETGELRMKK